MIRVKSVNYLVGVSWFVLSLFISSLNDVLTKYLCGSIGPYEVVFFRFLFSIITLLPFMLYYGKNSFITSRPLVHVIRGGLLFGGIALWSHALSVVVVTVATVISFTIPLFVLIFAKIFLGENVTLARWVATVVGLIGVVIVINPTSATFNIMSASLILASMMFAGLDVINKKYVIKESMFSMLFYSSIVTTALSSFPAFLNWSMPTTQDLLLLLILGAGANLILYFLLKAFALIDASAAAPYRYIELLISSFLGYLIFAEIPTINTVIGALIIIPCTLFVIYNEIKK
jgi:S-adenosylmethionine uptake transporter